MRLILPLKLVLGNDDGQWLPFRLVVGQQWAASIAAGYLQYYQLQSKMDQLSNAAHSLVHCRLHSVQLFTGRAATQVRDRRGRKVGSQRQVGSQILFTCWEILFVVRYWDDLMMKKNVQEVGCYGHLVIDDDVKSSCCSWPNWSAVFFLGIRVENYVGILWREEYCPSL